MSRLDEDNVFETFEMAIADQAVAALVERRGMGAPSTMASGEFDATSEDISEVL
ncbi:hypothetical protein [Bosea sp. 685]|uniref:hypothetical protein n=1 Tax=Bosea sp. 685 TaxID=3080057 RepID=UPI002892FB36|nr:hypothetical protein [Bosea sp. 685]WNJ92616.1 hypothetical protein RMR04_10080 [Bosea sp. 685]